LILKEPKEGDTSIRVQRVVYKEFPPHDCDPKCHYAWDGPEFLAYPDIGEENIEDYTDVWDGEELDAEQPYVKVYWERDRWFIERPSAGGATIDYCVILQTSSTVTDVSPPGDPDLGSFTVRVQRVHLNDAGRWEQKGLPVVAATRYNCPGTLYDDYRRANRNGFHNGDPTQDDYTWRAYTGLSPSPMVTFQLVKADGGIWVVEQPPPLVVRAVPVGTAGGCTTQ
jgi:hypothetical protein